MNKFYQLFCLGILLIHWSAFAELPETAQYNRKTTRNTSSNQAKENDLFEQGLELPTNKYLAAYNAPADICLKNGWDIDVTGSFIYWHVSEEFLDIALVIPVYTALPLTEVPGAL